MFFSDGRAPYQMMLALVLTEVTLKARKKKMKKFAAEATSVVPG